MYEALKIVGFSNEFSFTPTNSTDTITGRNFYFTEQMPNNRGTGEMTGKFFLSKSKIENNLAVMPKVGDNVTLTYNRYKSIVGVTIVGDEVDFGD